MKRLIGVVAAVSLILCSGARPAGAHTEAELRWEGAAVALGTLGAIVVLSDALDTGHHDGCGERWERRKPHGGNGHGRWHERDECGRGGHHGRGRGHAGKRWGWREGYCR